VSDSEFSSWSTVSEKIQQTDDEALLAAQVGLLCLHVSVSACVAFDKRPCDMTTKRRQDHRKWDRSVKYMYTCESGNVLKGV